MNTSHFPDNSDVHVLEEASLTIHQFARACNVSETWVVARVTIGVLELHAGLADEAHVADTQHWRFSGQGITRARRIADLERSFDADPQLAAMTADLIEEVQQLRARLGHHR